MSQSHFIALYQFSVHVIYGYPDISLRFQLRQHRLGKSFDP